MTFERDQTRPLGTPLPPGHVHVWSVPLHGGGVDAAYFSNRLAPEEINRAHRFRSEPDRRRYILRRAALKLILAKYLGVGSGEIRYVAGHYDKPSLVWPLRNSGLHFSLSHSADHSLIAVSYDNEIGIDIEKVSAFPDLPEVAVSILSNTERSIFNGLDESDKLKAFFRIWTQKEAYLKGRGLGLNQAPSSIDVTVPPAQEACLIQDRSAPEAAGAWSLRAWDYIPDYTAALAVHGCDSPVITLRDWHPDVEISSV